MDVIFESSLMEEYATYTVYCANVLVMKNSVNFVNKLF